VFLLAAAGVLPLLVYGAVSIYSLRDATRRSVISGNVNVARQVAEQIHLYGQTNVDILNSVAGNLENTNLAFALKENPDKGNIRETFILNQLLNSGFKVSSPPEGDFIIDGLTVEVGGKSKNASQVMHLDDYLIAADDIETGAGNKVPLWLFGFLY